MNGLYNIKIKISDDNKKIKASDNNKKIKKSKHIKKIKIYDSSYRVAIYISNEVLPSNFYFAPAVPFSSFPYWNVEMDFTFFCASIFYGMLNLKHVFTDPKLPFSLINQQIFPNRAYLNTKFQIILREVESIMPKNYKVEGKTINDISYFKLINWRLFNKTVISLNMKKQIFHKFVQ